MSRILEFSRKELGLGVAAACTVNLANSSLLPATSPAGTAASTIWPTGSKKAVSPPRPRPGLA